MTAVIHQFPNYEHEAKVLAERRRRDRIDPLWRANALRAPSLSCASRIEPRGVSTKGFNRLSQRRAS